MPLYVNQQAEGNLFNQGTGAQYPIVGDLAGNTYIRQSMFPSGFTYSNLARKYDSGGTAATVADGTVWATPIYLPGGFVAQTITFVSVGAGATMTHQWFGLGDANLKIVATTADDTNTAWAATSSKGLAIAKAGGVTATAYQVPQTTVAGSPVLYYALFLCSTNSGTVPTLAAKTSSTWAVNQVPKSGPTDQTSKTTPLASDSTVTFAFGTANTAVPLVGVS